LAERIAVSNPYDEIGRLTLTLNRMLDRVQQSVEEQSQFTADAAHELRTPLAVIRSSVEQTLSRPRTSDRYVTCLRTVVEEANRVSQLSNQLLLLSRERIAETEKNFIPMNLRLLLLDIVEDFEPLCELHGQFLKVELPVDLPVLGDARRLRSVFLNLLDNAVKFTPGGGSIELRATSGENVEVVVADSGIGIPEKDLPHLFQRFYRVERSRNRDFGGAGLGLAICQAIVQNHRGTISICSRWTQGTQVRISFPRRVEEPEIAAIRDFAARTPESANAD
jgi:signal transduction histidine kinase